MQLKTLLLAAALLVSAPCSAHEWYPTECCGGSDCGKVDIMSVLSNGDRLITFTPRYNVQMMVTFPAGFPTRPSPDIDNHACANPVFSPPKPLCLFLSTGF